MPHVWDKPPPFFMTQHLMDLSDDSGSLQPTQRGLVSVALVVWSSATDLPKCLEGILGQNYPNLEIIAVDNASPDDSIRLIQTAFPSARCILNHENRGYSAAHNQAIRASRGEFYLPLNPDIWMQPGYISRLVKALDDRPLYGSAVGKVLQMVESIPPLIDSAGLFIDRRRHQYLRGYGKPDRGQYNRAEEVFGADGAAPLHRMSMLKDTAILGECFDEQYFLYMEDVDLTWRARLLGWRCHYEPAAVAQHKRSFKPGNRRSIPKKLRRIAVKNRYLTVVKNESRECYRRDWYRILLYDILIWGYILLREQTSLGAIPMLRRQWERALAWRKEIHRRSRVAPKDQLEWFTSPLE